MKGLETGASWVSATAAVAAVLMLALVATGATAVGHLGCW